MNEGAIAKFNIWQNVNNPDRFMVTELVQTSDGPRTRSVCERRTQDAAEKVIAERQV